MPVIDPLSEKEGKSYIYYNKNLQFINLMENKYPVEVVDILRNCVSKAMELMFSLERNKVKFENIEKLRMLNGHKIYM